MNIAFALLLFFSAHPELDQRPDVSAIVVGHYTSYSCGCPVGALFCTTGSCTHEVETYGCADKSRVLLISEDGEHHCIRIKNDMPVSH